MITYFENPSQYANSINDWCMDLYNDMTDCVLIYDFCKEFALVDFYRETADIKAFYEKVKEKYISNYKMFTEVVISINLLAWANDRLAIQGYEEREQIKKFYSELYYVARSDYYKHYRGCQEECDYLYSMSD